MRTEDFDYPLPDELIAQAPAEARDSCRLLVLNREDGSVEHRHFFDILDYLEPGDLLVANKTRVMPARLVGKKRGTGGVCETLLLKRREDVDALGRVWECLVNPGKRLRQPGTVIEYRAGGLHAPESAPVVLTGTIVDFVEGSKGGRLVRFEPQGNRPDGTPRTLDVAIHEAGHVPLPPYITQYEGDPEKYQTVYAMTEEHSAAAPGGPPLHAGAHPEDPATTAAAGAVELEVGIDTFRLVTEDDPTQHVMHTERYHVSQEVVDAVHATKAAGHRVIAVGTTSVRSLGGAWDPQAPAASPACAAPLRDAPDSAAVCGRGDIVERRDAKTNLYLMPGSTFHVVDALITNFHVPRSTLMMLVSALATREQIMGAYRAAIDERYRFLSFGDAMLIR